MSQDAVLNTAALQALTGYTRPADIERCLTKQGVRIFWGKEGPWTTLDLINAADPHWEGSRQFLCADGVIRWAKPARWRPSIHMPRWASRITLEVTSVRVERLQDISERDAADEGLVREKEDWHGAAELPWFASPVAAYRSLWESINGAGSWSANPWVWVVEFRRIEQEAKAA